MTLAFVTWDRPGPSGGTTYGRELCAALEGLGCGVVRHELPGPWPEPAPHAGAVLEAVLAAAPVSVVDGIVATGAPEAVGRAVGAGARVVVLVHMALADEVGLPTTAAAGREEREGRALRAASAVVATSATAAADLMARHGVAGVRVARPGVRPAPVSPGSAAGGVPVLLCLANLTPTKDQLTLVRALARVADLPWRARLVGSAGTDPAYAAVVRAGIDDAGLGDRVTLTGALEGDDLDEEWGAGDLLLLVSRTETFGMVVQEALARAVPAVVGAGTGAVEALTGGLPERPGSPPPGAVVPPSDPAGLAEVLREWLADPRLRGAWRGAALRRREDLPTWETTAREVLAVAGPPG